MAAGYDGSIRIDTRVDSKGFNSGVNALRNALKPLARAIAITFSVVAIVAFTRTAVNEAGRLSAAYVGLQSVVEGTGGSFAVAQEFIEEFTDDGLVAATNAVNSYKNLLLRGYDTSQIEQTLTALKDSAAFGRRADLTIGEAVETATEGLKNENSILVDNAGVTKNVSMMWKDYAASIGTTVGALTKQQKIQAEVNGILQETRFQTGDAAKLASTYSGQLAALGTSLYNLRVAFGNVLIPILQAIMPAIKAVVDTLTVWLNRLGQIVSILFGVQFGAASQGMDDVAESTGAAADAQADLAKNTREAGKAAKGALAPFDELNVLAQAETSDGGGGAPMATPAAGGLAGAVFDQAAVDEEFADLKATVEGWKQTILGALEPVSAAIGRLMIALEPVKNFVGQALTDWYNEFLVPVGGWVLGEGLPRFIDAIAVGLSNVDWDRINESLSNLWDSLAPFAVNVGEGLLWLWENVLVPLGTYVINELLPPFLDGLAEVLDIVNQSIEDLKPFGEWLWVNFLEPIANWTGGVVAGALEEIAAALDKIGAFLDAHPTLSAIIGAIGLAFLLSSTGAFAFAAGLWATLSPILLVVAAIATIAWLINHWGEVVEWFKGVFERVIEDIKQRIAIWLLVVKGILDKLLKFFSETWDGISQAAQEAWDAVVEVFSGAWEWFEEHVVDPIAQGFETMLENLGTGWEETWKGIESFVKGVINTIIDFINGMIRAVAGGINAVIDALNKIKIDIPATPFSDAFSIGVNLSRVPVPQIPKLAQGAVIPPNAEFLAMMGDQRNGRNLEAPEGLIRQILQEELGNIQADIRIEFGGTWGTLIREMHPRIAQESIRLGRSMISGSASA